ncbi:PAP2 superfamily protein [Melghirimyces profundicolus]|uniref:PAP2 superfamily protein n=1 Tax=Melghirimyces profundicolus TaxID=1242148 RepID=A0A2T6BH14_9BACL|nr:phosphatase PAP2 family protein [Melghirimyces profundicolus]PTX55342.1 PAP2 superfamily protein [Melghirimyces profundicolus]
MFQSTTAIFATGLATFLIILAFCLRKNPFHSMVFLFRDLIQSRVMLFHLLGGMSILLLNKLELIMEPHLDPNVSDWTPYIKVFEENVTPLVQQLFKTPLLTCVTTYFYVIVFSTLMFASLFVYHHNRDYRSWYTLIYGISINYLLAIPFFLFAPVAEAWSSHPDVQFLIPTVYPDFEEQYRHFSGLNNSFPSLHTSISVTMAIIAWQSQNRRLAGVSALSAGIVLFAILYLGIHWYLDLIAGLVLASVSVSLASRLCEIPLGTHQLELSRRKASEQMSNLS